MSCQQMCSRLFCRVFGVQASVTRSESLYVMSADVFKSVLYARILVCGSRNAFQLKFFFNETCAEWRQDDDHIIETFFFL